MSTSKKSTRVIDLNNKEARAFFMKSESYVSLTLPEYFSFNEVLKEAEDLLRKKKNPKSYKDISDVENKAPGKKKEVDCENVNYIIISNKDGKYDWRPISIVHPVVYVDLVNTITDAENWEKLQQVFSSFEANKKIECTSIPIINDRNSQTNDGNNQTNDRNNQTKVDIQNWWKKIEQKSIKLALEYSYCVQTDITRCYDSIYTHSIAWAIEGKTTAKNNKHNSSLLGNKLDTKIRNAQNGQTNGIPQGGALFDFIAEMVLGYVDSILAKKINEYDIQDYYIIHYRDDYRIFSNSKEQINIITKLLSDSLSELNMHLNQKKTIFTSDLITSSRKADKTYWNHRKNSIYSKNCAANGFSTIFDYVNYHMKLQEHLIEIYELSKKYPNSGSITKALADYIDRLHMLKKLPCDYEQLISITANIIIENPKVISVGVTVISEIFKLMKNDQLKSKSANEILKYNTSVVEFVQKILKKLESIPNTDYLEIWLQRISIVVNKNVTYKTLLCKKVDNINKIGFTQKDKIWNSEWIAKGFDESSVIDISELNKVGLPIPKGVANSFDLYEY